MTNKNILDDWSKTFDDLLHVYENSKYAMEIPFSMLAKYDSLEGDELLAVHELLRQWLLLGYNKYHDMAVWIISLRKLREFAPFIRESIEHINSLQYSPQIKNEIEDLQRLLDELSS